MPTNAKDNLERDITITITATVKKTKGSNSVAKKLNSLDVGVKSTKFKMMSTGDNFKNPFFLIAKYWGGRKMTIFIKKAN